MIRYAAKVDGCLQWECAGKSGISETCPRQHALEKGLAWGAAKRRQLLMLLVLLLSVVVVGASLLQAGI